MIEARGHVLERVSAELGGYMGSVRQHREQNLWVWGSGGVGLVAGVLLTLCLPRVLPGSVDMAVASTVMDADRWYAGSVLMQSRNPGGWRSVVDANNFMRANQEALAACAEAAAKAKKDQRCTINVGVSQ